MTDRRLQQLDAALHRDPDDTRAWIERARMGERLGTPPPLPPGDHLPALLRAWSEAPEVRELGALVMPTLGLQALSGEASGRFWDLSGRRSSCPAGDWDAVTGLPLRVRRTQDGAEMRLVPAGAFLRGHSQGRAEERPSRQVSVSCFYLDRFPTTVASYRLFLEATGTPEPFDWTTQRRHPSFPVVQVTWEDARSYARWAGVDLPSEAQWEKAARGTDGGRYPWGDGPLTPSMADYLEAHPDLHADTGFYRQQRWPRYRSPAGRFPRGASPYGVEEMLGTVFEWCRDRYALTAYRSAPSADPPGPRRGSARVIRGGAWCTPGEDLASYRRASQRPWETGVDLGFRLALPLPGPTPPRTGLPR